MRGFSHGELEDNPTGVFAAVGDLVRLSHSYVWAECAAAQAGARSVLVRQDILDNGPLGTELPGCSAGWFS